MRSSLAGRKRPAEVDASGVKEKKDKERSQYFHTRGEKKRGEVCVGSASCVLRDVLSFADANVSILNLES